MAAEITSANDKRAAAERQVLIDVWDERLVVSSGIGVGLGCNQQYLLRAIWLMHASVECRSASLTLDR